MLTSSWMDEKKNLTMQSIDTLRINVVHRHMHMQFPALQYIKSIIIKSIIIRVLLYKLQLEFK